MPHFEQSNVGGYLRDSGHARQYHQVRPEISASPATVAVSGIASSTFVGRMNYLMALSQIQHRAKIGTQITGQSSGEPTYIKK